MSIIFFSFLSDFPNFNYSIWNRQNITNESGAAEQKEYIQRENSGKHNSIRKVLR